MFGANDFNMNFSALLTVLLSGLALLGWLHLSGQADSSAAHLRLDPESGDLRLTTAGAAHLASLAFHCIEQEYPNKLSHVMSDSSEVQSPRALHPAFYGCFDWHSSVHGHWMLVRLLKEFPDLEGRSEIRAALDRNLSAENLSAEVAYLQPPHRQSFERTYGWAWLLKLAEELHAWPDPDARRWAANLEPLAQAISHRYVAFLPKQTYPIRTGEHPNTAFGLSFAWDYGQALGDDSLKTAIQEATHRYFAFDNDCPASWEPGGADFLSPCLEEANLMQRLLAPEAFRAWFDRFLPQLSLTLQQPATVTDRSDGKLVHLDGLNLSRAWCLRGIAGALPAGDPRRARLRALANQHLQATLPNIASGDYAGEHWLASFAVYALSVAGK